MYEGVKVTSEQPAYLQEKQRQATVKGYDMPLMPQAPDREPTELIMFIGRSYENNANIRKEIEELKNSFMRFFDIANQLSPDAFYRNNQPKAELIKGPSPKTAERSGIIAKLDNLLLAQQDIIVTLAEFGIDLRETALFFEKHI